MTGFLPHEFVSNQVSSVAVSVMCRTCNLIVGVQYQSVLELFFLISVFRLFLGISFKGFFKRKEKIKTWHLKFCCSKKL